MKRDKGKPASMVAPQSREQTAVLSPVEDLATARGIQPWILAGLRQATGWAPGKQVSAAEFDAAVERFSNRPQGGGKI